MTKAKAVVYARVSTNHEEQKHSLKSQKEYYNEYAEKNGYDLIETYFDSGLTGTSFKRKYFLQMMYDAGLDVTIKNHSGILTFDTSNREPLFKYIILKDVSRFARNTDAIEVVKQLRYKGVYIIFENLNFSSEDDDWEFRFGLLVLFAQQESVDRSIKGKKAYGIRSENGKFHMTNVLLGYKRNPETKEYEIDEDKAHIVRFVFDLYVNKGKGTKEIASICNEKGFKTSKGKRFAGDSIIRLIKNEKYKGQVITGRYTHTDITGQHKRIELPRDQWNVFDNLIPAIIPTKVFDEAQAIMNRRVMNTKNYGRKGIKVPKSEFHKKIFCGKCGADYVRISSVKKRVNSEDITEYFYSCRNRRYSLRTGQKCDNAGISHNVLVRELTEISKKLHFSFNTTQIKYEKEELDKILKDLDYKLDNAESEKEKIKESISNLDKEIVNVIKSIRQGASETVKKVLNDEIEKIENEKAELNLKILEFDTLTIENKKQEYLDKYQEVLKFSQKKSFTYDDVLELIEGIHILEHREALVDLRTPTIFDADQIYKGENGSEYAMFPFTFKLP
ncbi:recombinase family protein [Virgibacillus halodenitrificans]|uniref:Recombinase family protein n=1 Tax=Virgibacillus halodenitrificans TaxID=1482 RepID=A0ABR7VM38_VIRHA|nr:recombinase family protein [Virgibacillus halodenitrificans]MBD1222743.1 recombinase family protein [Virgibacillus halodenitrificans]